ncbi:MAG: DUF2400 domain-containing protein [Rikenellaceae bacterium]|nr:DUF2400 domain-containing protein [Rikenellaceae bacterium]
MDDQIERLKNLSAHYNNIEFFTKDPIVFPRLFSERYFRGEASLQDVEIAGILSSHLAWGRREMIFNNCTKMFDEMKWLPVQYIMGGVYRNDPTSLHRTIKWKDFAGICENLRTFYSKEKSLENFSPTYIRTLIFGSKPDPNAANKKIHMFRRWMVRNDGIVDLGVWKKSNPADLIIPLDVHVHRSALELGITTRKSADLKTALEITGYLRTIFPSDPCIGDFALFAFAATTSRKNG